MNEPVVRVAGATVGVVVCLLVALEAITVVSVSDGLAGTDLVTLALGVLAFVVLGVAWFVTDTAFQSSGQ